MVSIQSIVNPGSQYAWLCLVSPLLQSTPDSNILRKLGVERVKVTSSARDEQTCSCWRQSQMRKPKTKKVPVSSQLDVKICHATINRVLRSMKRDDPSLQDTAYDIT